MRAVTGTITSTRPSPIAKAAHILFRFEKVTPSALLSSDAATYLRTAIEAVAELHRFQGNLRGRQQRKGGGESDSKRKHRPAPVDEDGRRQQREGGGESERRHRPAPVDEDGRHQQREGGAESERRHRPAPVDEDGRWEPKVEAEDDYARWEPKEEEEEEYRMTVPAAGEKKSSDRKGSRKDEKPWEEKQGIAAPRGDLRSPASEKRRKKKEKRVKDEDETGDAIEEQSRKALGDALQGSVSGEGIDSGKKVERKKKHLKQEDLGAKEAEHKMVHVGVAENGLASEEKRRKKRKHTEEKEVKKEVVDAGDLGSDKKRKKKRDRDGDNSNDTELGGHTKKKQRK